MTSGRADWFGLKNDVDIIAQSISEIQNRPKYGGARELVYSGTITEGNDVDIFSIAGEGMLYGGFIHHSFTGNPGKIAFGITIDGSGFSTSIITGLNNYSITAAHLWYLFEVLYDDAGDEFVQGISREVTFETSYVLNVGNLTGSTASDTINARLIYALV